METVSAVKALSKLAAEICLIAREPDIAASNAAALRLFRLPEHENVFLTPGEGSGFSPAEQCASAEKVGLRFERDVQHGKLFRHPVATTWITSISMSPGDVRSSRNATAELRNGYRAAADRVLGYFDAVRKVVSVGKVVNITPDIAEGMLERLSKCVEEAGDADTGAARYYYIGLLERTAALSERIKQVESAVDVCEAGCDCLFCSVRAAVRDAKMKGESTEEGGRLFYSSLRKALRDYPTTNVATILSQTGINQPLAMVLAKLFREGKELSLPPAIGESVNKWVEEQREKARQEKEAKKARNVVKTPAELIDAFLKAAKPSPAVASFATLADATNAYRRETEATIQSLDSALRAATNLLDLARTSVADPATTERLKVLEAENADLTAKLTAAAADKVESVRLAEAAGESGLIAFKGRVGTLLKAIAERVENVRAMRLTDDLAAITDSVIQGAIDLEVEFKAVAQPT